MDPQISVIVPTYNQACYLPACLDSIWFQDYPDVEIIVINDGSSDATATVLTAYQQDVATEMTSYAANLNEETGEVERVYHRRYPPPGRILKVLHNDQNLGLSATLNRGFQAAAGPYVTFIASDDMLLPSMLSELYQALMQSDADFAYADMHIVDDQGRIRRRFSLPDYSFEACFCTWYLCGVCKLYKRSLHDLAGWYDTTIAPQDHDMFLRFALNGARFVHVPKVLANVRIHDSDRQVINHAPEQWSRLFRESAARVREARRMVKAQS
ncbi:MAG: glycosyltransferase [Planctomycetes bacterium]|nr:glycosyltransferase [Planctomycetota bacterium]